MRRSAAPCAALLLCLLAAPAAFAAADAIALAAPGTSGAGTASTGTTVTRTLLASGDWQLKISFKRMTIVDSSINGNTAGYNATELRAAYVGAALQAALADCNGYYEDRRRKLVSFTGCDVQTPAASTDRVCLQDDGNVDHLYYCDNNCNLVKARAQCSERADARAMRKKTPPHTHRHRGRALLSSRSRRNPHTLTNLFPTTTACTRASCR
jgi:hypothetical protein